MNNRLQKLREQFPRHEIEALMVSHPRNCTYLSGFTGTSAALVISRQNAYLLTDFRYIEQAREQCPHFEIIEVKEELHSTLARLLFETGIRKLGFEADYLTYHQFTSLQEKLPAVNLVPTTKIIQKLRAIKDANEIAAIEKSMHILDRAFTYIMEKLKPGLTEREISLELEIFARREGAEEKAFPFIVASGPRSALPHGTASDRVIQEGDLVTIDFGVTYNGYASDMTRTVVIGRSSKRQEEIYNIVLKAQLAGLAAVRAGVKASEVDRASRAVIEEYGFGPCFGHSTGHGVGLEVHESPRLAKKDDTILEPGMVVTVEPGIYLPQWGGVRIEDTVVVEEDTCRILCNSPKDKLICI